MTRDSDGGNGNHQVTMLLDNHYGPDARVAFEIGLLEDAGISAKVVAWDRRSTSHSPDESSGGAVVRVAVPAPSGGGWRTLVALSRFARNVWCDRGLLFGDASLICVHDIYLLPVGWALARRLGIPFVYDAHEEFERAEAQRYPAPLRRLAAATEGRLARDAAAVVVPGASRAPRWAGVIEAAPIVVPNFVHREQARPSRTAPEWDLLYAGTISPVRRPDLLVELARLRPELRIAIAGGGRGAKAVEEAARDLPNLQFLGWREDVDALIELARSLYYGLDPEHPYSDVACPNTLYQALRHRKPLIFFCGGEPAELAGEFRIGIRSAPTVSALEQAVDDALREPSWQFDAAWQAVWTRADLAKFVSSIKTATKGRE